MSYVIEDVLTALSSDEFVLDCETITHSGLLNLYIDFDVGDNDVDVHITTSKLYPLKTIHLCSFNHNDGIGYLIEKYNLFIDGLRQPFQNNDGCREYFNRLKMNRGNYEY